MKIKTFKVARPSILKFTPSISESLILSFVIFGIFVCNALCYVFFRWLSPAVWSFTQIYKRNFEISWNFYGKGIIMHVLRLDLTQTNLLLFGCFHRGFIAHSFCKSPLYTLWLDSSDKQEWRWSWRWWWWWYDAVSTPSGYRYSSSTFIV